MAATVAFSVAAGEPGPTYARHRPEDTVLYQVLAEHWRSYRAQVECANPQGSGLPPFVVDEVEAFLRCGIPANGFLRVVCDGCGGGRLVPFSCKRRGFCPSCLGRRMADFAAHLCDYVMPRLPVRQWVLTVPFGDMEQEAIAMYRSAGYKEVDAFNSEPYAQHWFEKRLA